jgi:hypothetical protein
MRGDQVTRRLRRAARGLSGSMLFSLALLAGCGDDDDDGTEAQRHGVGAACTGDVDCWEPGQHCLDFKAGYCGVADCASNLECPSGSACVRHEDGKNYCFLICTDKVQCNRTRPPEAEANCSANIEFVDGDLEVKACVPPSG